MTAVEDYEEATGGLENRLDGSELVVYSATAEWADEEPTHDNLRELGLASWSLWARWEERGTEIPLVAEASWHMWYSLSAESFSPDPAEPVSDAFVAATARMVDEDVGDGWGDPGRETWEAMSDLEQYVWGLVRHAFIEEQNAEPAMVIEWCVNQYQAANGGLSEE